MLESLRLWPLLAGYRHEPAVNIDLLVELLMRFSYFVTDFPEMVEIDVNPLWVSAEQIIACRRPNGGGSNAGRGQDAAAPASGHLPLPDTIRARSETGRRGNCRCVRSGRKTSPSGKRCTTGVRPN